MNKLIVGNWKMNGTKGLVDDFITSVNKNVVLALPNIFISYAISRNPDLQIASQDCSIYCDFGAHTGEISAKMLSDVGCRYVILGHSERRKTSNFDTSQNILLKIKNAIECDMTVILCVDENYQSLIDNETYEFLKKNCNKIIIAYEPLSAIGTGIIPTQQDISITLKTIKEMYFGVKTLYGGSVNSSNAHGILSTDNVDGILIGGASLKLDELNKIANL